MGDCDGFVDGDVLGGGVAIGPFVVGDSVASSIGSEVCMPKRSGEVCLPMERSAACRNGVVVQLLKRGPLFGEDPGSR